MIAGPAEELALGIQPLDDILKPHGTTGQAGWTLQVSQIAAVGSWGLDRPVQVNPLQFRSDLQYSAGNPSLPHSAEQATDGELFQNA